jgi:hypothetical protein
MSESNLSLSYPDFANAISDEYGIGPDYTEGSASEIATVDRLVQEGYRLAMFPPVLPNDTQRHIWSWLRPIRSIATVAPYSTGTITIEAGTLTTVTLAGGTWPAWAADAQIVINGRPYRVLSREGDDELTLAENGPESDAGTSYQLQRYFYTMDDDYGGIEGPITFQGGVSSRTIQVVGEGRIRELQQSCTLTGRPVYAAEHWTSSTQGATSSSRARIQFEPIPDQEYLLTYRCKLIPNKLDDTTMVYPLGGMEFGQTIKAACLACVERYLIRQQGPRYAEFMTELQASIFSDRQRGPEVFMPGGQQYIVGDDGGAWPYSPHYVVYTGSA